MSAEYTPTVLAELVARVSAAVGRWGMSPDTRVRLLNVSENATYRLSDSRTGRELVLRVHRLGYSSAEEIRSELAWIDALRRAAVVETAAPVTGVDGALVQRLASRDSVARFAVAFEWVPGREPDSRDAVQWFERLGELTARMHRHSVGWQLPPGFQRKRWNLDAMVGPCGYWGPWRAGIGMRPSHLSILEHALSLVQRRLERFGVDSDVFGLVHADLRLANLLVDGTRLRIIDFDDCGFSWFLYDFATAVSFIERDPGVPALLAAWLAGYGKVRALRAAQRAEIPTFVVLRRILLTAWLASHAEVPFAREFGASFTEGTAELAEEFARGSLLKAAIT